MVGLTNLAGCGVGAAGETLLLLDAFSLIFQAYHARSGLRTSTGLPTNAVHTFASMILSILETERPAAVALCFDTPEPTFRHREYPEYKAHRPPPEEDMLVQLPLIDELVAAMGWPALKLPGWEADDLLATISERAAAAGWQVLILTADRDLCQLASDQVTILATRAMGVREVHRFTPDAVIERFGVPPERLPDWKGLVGDSSDNLPGVKGIGEKGATQLLQQYGTLDAVLAAADEQTGKRRENLLADADQARRTRELATVRRDAPVECDLDGLRRRPADETALAELFARLEMRELQRRLSPRAVTAPRTLDYRQVANAAAAQAAERAVAEAGVVGLSTSAAPPGVAVSTGDSSAWFLPLGAGGQGQMSLFGDDAPDAQGLARLERVLAPVRDGRVGYLVHHAQPLFESGWAVGPGDGKLVGDSHIAAWLLDPDRAEHPPDTLAGRVLGWTPPADASGLEPGAHAACLAADLARRLEPRLRDELEEQKLLGLYADMELPLVPLLGRMMATGIGLDVAAAEALDTELAERIEAMRADLTRLAGRPFNPDSPKQLQELLFIELGLPAGRKTKTGYSTDAATLAAVADRHPVVPAILEYREFTKLKSTYTEAFLSLVDPARGRLRTSLNQTGTSTGRLSSSRPNLQNIPVRGQFAERIRMLFRAPDGWRIVAADYSQIELRVLAHVTGDARLKQAFRDDLDIHNLAASEIFGVPADEVTAEMRRRAKVLNFGVAYGMQAHGLSQSLDIPRDEAAALIEAYFTRFAGVRRYAVEVVERARERGYVQTFLGRRRPVPDLRSPNPQIRQAAERVAINMPIQGAASDIIKRAMLRLEAMIAERGLAARLLLQVHDELLLEAPEAEVEATAQVLAAAMEGAAELDVPLVAKVEVGQSWGDLVAYSG